LLGEFRQRRRKSIGNFRTVNQSINQSRSSTLTQAHSRVELWRKYTQNDENSPSKGRKKGEKERDWKEEEGRKESILNGRLAFYLLAVFFAFASLLATTISATLIIAILRLG